MCPDPDRGPVSWVDPREHPDPPLRVLPRPPAPDASGIIELVRLCREGHLYEVERWIRDGKPLHALDYRTSGSHHLQSPLWIVIESRQHDLTQLLLCNGYEPERGLETSLDLTLDARAWDIVDLLIDPPPEESSVVEGRSRQGGGPVCPDPALSLV